MTLSCSVWLRSLNELRMALMVSMGGLSPEWTRVSKKDEAVPSCISFGMWVGRTACRSR